jgi:hypothetical protein
VSSIYIFSHVAVLPTMCVCSWTLLQDHAFCGKGERQGNRFEKDMQLQSLLHLSCIKIPVTQRQRQNGGEKPFVVALFKFLAPERRCYFSIKAIPFIALLYQCARTSIKRLMSHQNALHIPSHFAKSKTDHIVGFIPTAAAGYSHSSD